VYNARKIQVLEFLERKSWIVPSELAKNICPTLQAAYVYLKRLHRQGFCFEIETAFQFATEFPSVDWINYLRGSQIADRSLRSGVSDGCSLR
jgi:hypothetical protein